MLKYHLLLILWSFSYTTYSSTTSEDEIADKSSTATKSEDSKAKDLINSALVTEEFPYILPHTSTGLLTFKKNLFTKESQDDRGGGINHTQQQQWRPGDANMTLEDDDKEFLEMICKLSTEDEEIFRKHKAGTGNIKTTSFDKSDSDTASDMDDNQENCTHSSTNKAHNKGHVGLSSTNFPTKDSSIFARTESDSPISDTKPPKFPINDGSSLSTLSKPHKKLHFPTWVTEEDKFKFDTDQASSYDIDQKDIVSINITPTRSKEDISSSSSRSDQIAKKSFPETKPDNDTIHDHHSREGKPDNYRPKFSHIKKSSAIHRHSSLPIIQPSFSHYETDTEDEEVDNVTMPSIVHHTQINSFTSNTCKSDHSQFASSTASSFRPLILAIIAVVALILVMLVVFIVYLAIRARRFHNDNHIVVSSQRSNVNSPASNGVPSRLFT